MPLSLCSGVFYSGRLSPTKLLTVATITAGPLHSLPCSASFRPYLHTVYCIFYFFNYWLLPPLELKLHEFMDVLFAALHSQSRWTLNKYLQKEEEPQ